MPSSLTFLISHGNWQGILPSANGCQCQAYECPIRELARVLSTSYQMAVCAKLTISCDDWLDFLSNANGCLCQDLLTNAYEKSRGFPSSYLNWLPAWGLLMDQWQPMPSNVWMNLARDSDLLPNMKCFLTGWKARSLTYRLEIFDEYGKFNGLTYLLPNTKSQYNINCQWIWSMGNGHSFGKLYEWESSGELNEEQGFIGWKVCWLSQVVEWWLRWIS